MVMQDSPVATTETTGTDVLMGTDAAARPGRHRLGWTAASLALVGALVLAVLLSLRTATSIASTEVASVDRLDPAPAVADPGAEPLAATDAAPSVPSVIPADFPLAHGQSADDEATRPEPGEGLEGRAAPEICGMQVAAGHGEVDRLSSVGYDGEPVDERDLLLFADADAAAGYLASVRSAVAECRVDRSTDGGSPVRFAVPSHTSGYDDLYVTATGAADGTYHLLRVGAAVLVRYAAPMPLLGTDEYLTLLTDENRAIALEMCVFTAAGCN
ncbi:hypothetical protein E8D34_13760 [Nocardioides sp. GY 10113]|uniref:hypothetical protein n=1 Tax=Nocardioides sp. GY 10113 TaxID=2569761 RepID=UPI0010A8AC73|nr:hypothetical protein [Nocardioides sp. GY 10113]TIC85129.1 hypothetical protein E8D34_13760 [Nocardioides sp. GY 10113]